MGRRPGSRQRFKKLAEAYKLSGGAAPAGTRAGEYANFLKGTNKITVARKPSSALLKRQRCKVIPFGYTPEATIPASYVFTAFTGQAYAIYNSLGANNNAFGLVPVITESDATGARAIAEFFPALARVFVTTNNAASTTRTSNITKEPYKSVLGRSGSIPFGRGITSVTDAKSGTAETSINEVDEADVVTSIAADVIGATAGSFVVKSITFVPEAILPEAVVAFAAATPPTLVG